MRRLAIVVLAGSGCGCGLASARLQPPEAAAPRLWVEQVPTVEPELGIDAEAWSGVWTEYFPGKVICQDRFALHAEGVSIAVESFDCSTDWPYAISEVRWDGQTLRFVAELPGRGLTIRYAVELDGPEQISGTANDTEITWSRTQPDPDLGQR